MWGWMWNASGSFWLSGCVFSSVCLSEPVWESFVRACGAVDRKVCVRRGGGGLGTISVTVGVDWTSFLGGLGERRGGESYRYIYGVREAYRLVPAACVGVSQGLRVPSSESGHSAGPRDSRPCERPQVTRFPVARHVGIAACGGDDAVEKRGLPLLRPLRGRRWDTMKRTSQLW